MSWAFIVLYPKFEENNTWTQHFSDSWLPGLFEKLKFSYLPTCVSSVPELYGSSLILLGRFFSIQEVKGEFGQEWIWPILEHLIYDVCFSLLESSFASVDYASEA